MRRFKTGATRDSNTDKLEYMRFMSPAVIKRYAEFMNKHRLSKDGKLREADNWKRGMTRSVYMDSLGRHVNELWQHHEGIEIPDDVEDVLAAIIFNASGYLYETLAARGAAGNRPKYGKQRA